MVDSNRELILEAIKDTLENITVSNGFSNTVTKIERKMRAWNDPHVTPPV